MKFKQLNNVFGWSIFAIATAVYLLTMESTASLWDCGEYITAAYKLEVGHPPGAPLFMVLGRMFSFFASPDSVAIWINALSALSSSFTVLFMFWSLTLMLRKLVLKQKNEVNTADGFMILAASAIASLAYTFSDSFWFSAVEGEVYAMASLFTAVIFWAALKWDEEMRSIEIKAAPNRWIIMIFFMLGLAVGVHLLGILVVPAIGFLIYFNLAKKVDFKGILITGVVSVASLYFIQEGIIPGSVALASKIEVAFVNTYGLPFYSGTVFFFLLLAGACSFGIYYARKKQKPLWYNAIMGLTVLMIGYSSFAVIVIRSNANTPLDENDPENLVTLHSYLKREQYGKTPPLSSGPFWNSEYAERDEWKDMSPFYLRRFVIVDNESEEKNNEIKAFVEESDAKDWVKNNRGNYSIEEKYFESNASIREHAEPVYSQNTLFPRMYDGSDPNKVEMYKKWSGYDAEEGEGAELGRDGKRLPTMGENLTYFYRYQVDWMYTRYLLWNFAGRQNDIQGNGDALRGNWISGIDFIDGPRVGTADSQPLYTSENASNNKFFLIPLVFAVLGIFFHFYRSPKDAFVLLLAFLFTGIAIVVYLNQKPMEPRERDYAYAGSFYFFAMWIAFGVYAVYDFVTSLNKKTLKSLGGFIFGGLVLSLMTGYARLWIVLALLMALAVGVSYVLSKINQGRFSLAGTTFLGLVVPIIMGVQGWDDHDRSGKTSARDLAYNYLSSCKPNAILFTNGDNDTFPLWYLQEVEGIRTDVRVCNLSLMGTDWYTNQMKLKAYESDALPIKFREDQILMYAGSTDQVALFSLLDLSMRNKEAMERALRFRLKYPLNRTIAVQKINYFASQANVFKPLITPKSNPEVFEAEWSNLVATDGKDLFANLSSKYDAMVSILAKTQGGTYVMDPSKQGELFNLFQDLESSWNYVDFSDAMAFVRDDRNMLTAQQGSVAYFPSQAFSLRVNKANVVKSGIVKANRINDCVDTIRFQFDAQQDSYLTRDEVMMMDVVANNDWKRGIYFSSNRGSSFSMALLRSGWIRQVGMAYVLSPLKQANVREPDFYDLDEMYHNLMEVYQYGDMANPSVLTDYYARRHTSQFRVNFLLLAEQLQRKGKTKKAVEVLDKSLKVMPFETVLDVGEVHGCDPLNMLTVNSPHREYVKEGFNSIYKSVRIFDPYNIPPEISIRIDKSIVKKAIDNRLMIEYNVKNAKVRLVSPTVSSKCSGNLSEYVQLYTICGADTKALELGNKLLTHYESMVNFYLVNSDIAVNDMDNMADLYAVLDALYKLNITLLEMKKDKTSFGKRVNRCINLINEKVEGKLLSACDEDEKSKDAILENIEYRKAHYGYPNYAPKSAIQEGF
jgi:hypothetical protein